MWEKANKATSLLIPLKAEFTAGRKAAIKVTVKEKFFSRLNKNAILYIKIIVIK